MIAVAEFLPVRSSCLSVPMKFSADILAAVLIGLNYFLSTLTFHTALLVCLSVALYINCVRCFLR